MFDTNNFYDEEPTDIIPSKNAWGYHQHVRPTQGMGFVIPHLNPHYTDKRFNSIQLIWGLDRAPNWVYDDRMEQWNYNKSRDSFERAGEKHSKGTAEYYQEYLRLYNDDNSIVLVGIAAGVNLSNGYPYLVFGYKTGKDKPKE